MSNKNLILVGMPGCGKSTIGSILAKRLKMNFTDTDRLIRKKTGKNLIRIINEDGIDCFLKTEEEVLLSMGCENTVISTGGSAVYSEAGMEYLKSTGRVLYLCLTYESVEKRLGNFSKRGVVLPDGKTLRDIYDERTPLYRKYADVLIDANNSTIHETVNGAYVLIGKSLKKKG